MRRKESTGEGGENASSSIYEVSLYDRKSITGAILPKGAKNVNDLAEVNVRNIDPSVPIDSALDMIDEEERLMIVRGGGSIEGQRDSKQSSRALSGVRNQRIINTNNFLPSLYGGKGKLLMVPGSLNFNTPKA
jgi:hypothetical protein